MIKILTLLFLGLNFLSATPQDIHAFLPQGNTVNFNIGFEKVNDKLDIFNIKEKELDKSGKSFSSLGDMEGIDFNMGLTFSKKYYLNINLNQKRLNYLGSQLTTKRLDVYLRRQLYHSDSWAFAIDVGYTTNQADDTYMDSVESINNILEDILPNKEIKLKEIEDKQVLFYRGDDKSIKTVELENRAYVKIKDTYDKGFYTRAVLSLHQKKWLFDIFMAYSEVKIENNIDSSVFDEKNSDLQKELGNILLLQKRKDIIYLTGIGVEYTFNKQWKGNFNYQYSHILRIDYLKNNNNNHTFNMNVTYKLNSKIDFYLGGKVMLSQFNGEIPYIYTQYNSGSFHHKYGFANGGVAYRF